MRRAHFGQTSERGEQIIEQLELAIVDLEKTQAEVEAKSRDRHAPRCRTTLVDRRTQTVAPDLVCSYAARARRASLALHLRQVRSAWLRTCLGEIVTETLERAASLGGYPARTRDHDLPRLRQHCGDAGAVASDRRSRAGPHLLALVLASKYGNHLPLNCQRRDLRPGRPRHRGLDAGRLGRRLRSYLRADHAPHPRARLRRGAHLCRRYDRADPRQGQDGCPTIPRVASTISCLCTGSLTLSLSRPNLTLPFPTMEAASAVLAGLAGPRRMRTLDEGGCARCAAPLGRNNASWKAALGCTPVRDRFDEGSLFRR